MKNYFLGLVMTSLLAVNLALAQTPADSTGLDGDNFSLEGALEMFKNAESMESFEKLLNSEDNSVNNLDLNNDDKVDYVRVIDQSEDDVHSIVLQVPLNDSDSQDVAMIGIEKQGPENAVLQIMGDADLYGEEKIIEPSEVVEKQGKKGGPNGEIEITEVVVNVWLWPSVRFLYAPGYVVYVSPWRWGFYPSYWSFWRPHPWARYHRARYHYNHRYRIATTRRVVRARRVYQPHRRYSTQVRSRNVTRHQRNQAVRRNNPNTRPNSAPRKKANAAPRNKTNAPNRNATKPRTQNKKQNKKKSRTKRKN